MIHITLTLVASLLLLIGLLTHFKAISPQPDSELKRRALLISSEQTLYHRLHDILPNSYIMAHVSFDALLTTKLKRTRHKYQNMIADFVILDAHFKVLAIVGLSDALHSRRQQQQAYQDQLLQLAGYRVLRYTGVPEYQTLHRDFKQGASIPHLNDSAQTERLKLQFMARP